MLVASWQTAALLSLIFLQELLFFCNAVLQSLTGIMLRATLIALVNAFLGGGQMWKSTCLSCYPSRFCIFTPCSMQLFWQENFSGGGFAVVYAGSKFAAVSSPKFVANSSYHITSLSMVLLLFNLQLGCHFLPDFFWAALCEAETRFGAWINLSLLHVWGLFSWWTYHHRNLVVLGLRIHVENCWAMWHGRNAFSACGWRVGLEEMRVTKLHVCRCWSLTQVDLKPRYGRVMDAKLVKESLPLSVWMESVQFEVKIANDPEVYRTAVLASNSHGQAQIGVTEFSIHGIR